MEEAEDVPEGKGETFWKDAEDVPEGCRRCSRRGAEGVLEGEAEVVPLTVIIQ